MVEFTLSPVVLLLQLKPFRGHKFAAKRIAAAFKDIDHCERVVALTTFDSKPRLNATKELLGSSACRASPGPTLPGVAACA